MKTLHILVLTLLFTTTVFLPFGVAQEAAPENILQLIYFYPRDRAPQPDIDTKIDTLIKEVQRFFAEEMEAHGYGRKTFAIQTDANGKAVVHHQIGRYDEIDYLNEFMSVNAAQVYTEVESATSANHIYLAVLDVRSRSNFYKCGAATENVAFIDAHNDCFDASIAAHEIAHTFGVAHVASPAFLMSTIYPGDKRTLSPCTASFLDGVAYFNPDQPALNTGPTTIQMLRPLAVPPYGLRLRFKIRDADGLHHAHLETPIKDREFYSIYIDVCESLSGKSDTVEFLTTGVIPEHPYVLVMVVDGHGNYYKQEFPLDVNAVLPSEVVEIPDVHLADALREGLVMPRNAPITTHSLRALIDLYARDRQITDLTGLEHAINLRTLDLGAEDTWEKGIVNSNSISDISPLARLKKLETLFLDHNQIRDVRPLERLTNLKILRLQENPIQDRKPLFNLLQKNPDVEIYLKSGGEPLPVTLSHFQAEYTKTGVVIKWTTESELDNAGFYPLRSETKDGTFEIVNSKLFPGAGTTSERNTYIYTDTTAKPNIVYYYRIEDVSHAGVRKQLATVRVRGLVSASGKFQTRWAGLKVEN